VKRARWPRERAFLAAAFSSSLSVCLGLAVGCKSKAPDATTTTGAVPLPSASAPPARSVRLDRRPDQVGEKRHVTGNSALTMSVEFWKDGEKLGTNDSRRLENHDSTMQVLSLVGGVPAKGSVHYDHYKLEESAPNKPPGDPPDLEGKTYLVDATGDKLVVQGAGPKPLPAADVEALKKLHGDLGKGDLVVAAIGDAPFTEGHPLTMRRELLKALVTSGSGELKSGRIWLDQLRTTDGREEAVFKWSADTQSQEQNGLEITWHMTGTAVVAVSPATTISTSLKGSLDVSGETMQGGARVTMAGAGTITEESAVSILRP
jgi:hypothetical protein